MQISHKRKPDSLAHNYPPDEAAPAIQVEADIEAILKKYNITKEEYEKRFFWHEGKIAIVK